MSSDRKPRLLFFQNRYDARLPPFLLTRVQERVRCLDEFFDVTVLDDCDHDEVCDRYQPDLVLVESGVNHLTCRRPLPFERDVIHREEFFSGRRAGFIDTFDVALVDTSSFGQELTVAELLVEIAADDRSHLRAGADAGECLRVRQPLAAAAARPARLPAQLQ